MLILLRNQILKILILSSFLAILAFHLAVPINLTVADIGRHIKNGELILGGQTDVLYKNFYSFTYPDYHFINHHWLFGVIAYLVYKLAGFGGLSLGYIALLLAAFLLFFDSARRMSNFSTALFLSAAAFWLIIDRKEIRPEGFSIFFMGIYFYLLLRFEQGSVPRRMLFIILPLTQLLWVNTHIFFFMGPVLTAIFLWQAQIEGKEGQVRILGRLLAISLLINVINPSGLAGMLTPLHGFQPFGYSLAENQTVWFMYHRFPQEIAYKIYAMVFFVMIVGIFLSVRRQGWRCHFPMLVLAVFVLVAGFKAVRLLMPLGFLLIPLGAYFYSGLTQRPLFRKGVLVIAVVLLVIYGTSIPKSYAIGLLPNINASAEFFKNAGLKGPIFSNYDIGGYLIYHLQGREKVFVDNRQEAFPVDFFQKIYIPMQEDAAVWQQQQAQYHFNVIYFFRLDLTPWGQQFLIDRVRDPQWAPVFVDGYTIIFVRRGSVNQDLISHYELPKSMFGIVNNEAGQSK